MDFMNEQLWARSCEREWYRAGQIAHESLNIGAGESPRVIPINPILSKPLNKLFEIVAICAKGFR
jgi:hypothetical protein